MILRRRKSASSGCPTMNPPRIYGVSVPTGPRLCQSDAKSVECCSFKQRSTAEILTPAFGFQARRFDHIIMPQLREILRLTFGCVASAVPEPILFSHPIPTAASERGEVGSCTQPMRPKATYLNQQLLRLRVCFRHETLPFVGSHKRKLTPTQVGIGSSESLIYDTRSDKNLQLGAQG